MITQELITNVLKERMDRLEYLINQGRFDDAICIGEEFHEWISTHIDTGEPST